MVHALHPCTRQRRHAYHKGHAKSATVWQSVLLDQTLAASSATTAPCSQTTTGTSPLLPGIPPTRRRAHTRVSMDTTAPCAWRVRWMHVRHGESTEDRVVGSMVMGSVHSRALHCPTLSSRLGPDTRIRVHPRASTTASTVCHCHRDACSVPQRHVLQGRTETCAHPHQTNSALHALLSWQTRIMSLRGSGPETTTHCHARSRATLVIISLM